MAGFFDNLRDAMGFGEFLVKRGTDQLSMSPRTAGNDALKKLAQRTPSNPNFTKDANNLVKSWLGEDETQKPWTWDDEMKMYSNAGSRSSGGDPESLDWMSYTVRNNDNDTERRIDVGYDEDGRIGGVREFNGKSGGAMGYYGGAAIADYFRNNYDMNATNYTVSSAPIDIFDPNDVPQEYHDKATVFFDSEADDAFIPSQVFNKNNYGVRWFGDRKSTIANRKKVDSEPFDFVKEYRKSKLMENTVNRNPPYIVNPWSYPSKS